MGCNWKKLSRLGLALLLANCSQDYGIGAQGEKAEPPTERTLRRQVFETQLSNSSAIDLVWTIDNSGSMAAEIEHVRANLSLFMQSLSSKRDLRVALISAAGTSGIKVALSPADLARGHVQLDQIVLSNNPALLATVASCPAAGDPNASAELDLMCTKLTARTSNAANPNLRGSLATAVKGKPFFRPQAQKIYAFVTDDDSLGSKAISGNEFRQIQKLIGGIEPKVYGFIGLGDNSPCQSYTGLVYIELIRQFGGASFNICDLDWTPHFSGLTQSILKLTNNRFGLLSPTVSEVVSVKVDGIALNSSDFALDGLIVTIDPSRLSNESDQRVEIQYYN